MRFFLNMSPLHKGTKEFKKGFTLVECLVSIAVFATIAACVYQGYIKILNAVNVSHLKISAIALGNEQLEIIRNLPYADVGLVNGIPSGKIPHEKNITRDGVLFKVIATIRNTDDPFDGLAGGTPNDLSPADYKLISLEISCPANENFQPINFTTFSAPKNLETASTNGALFIRVFDANGQPVQGASIHIENNKSDPIIIIDDSSNNDGMLQVVDALPGVEAYEISVSKEGYSSERTYGSDEVLNPVKPHATVVLQQVSQISFSIDRISEINIFTMTDTCVPVGNVGFSFKGAKLLGAIPDVYKYDQNLQTDASGAKSLGNMEWDDYSFYFNDETYNLAGSMPLAPLNLSPDTSQDLKFIVSAKNPQTVLVTVKDAGTLLPLANASVKIESGAFSDIHATGRGYLRQTDWSGGSGQEDYINNTEYFECDGNLENNNPAGELRLRKDISGIYSSSGELTSSTFDTGSASNFYQIIWQPEDQPLEAGTDSVRFQIASNNDMVEWNFSGPDGTEGTYYTLADTNINSVNNGHRYFRYKIFLHTDDTAFTPNVAEAAFTFTSLCVPPGQVAFSGLSSGIYKITASKSGYQDSVIEEADVLSSWQQQEIMMPPE
ncbi:MAG: prepilin-type N-terminal cleavage/methylation domain-containing protein [bacterium]